MTTGYLSNAARDAAGASTSHCIWALCLLACLSCRADHANQSNMRDSSAGTVRLLVLDPGHYHAALVQKYMYDNVDPVVGVYAPAGAEVRDYLERIDGFNTRAEEPTSWRQQVYLGDDCLDQMLARNRGGVVVLSGNNRRKIEYLTAAVAAGFDVLCDKPMCIDPEGFRSLERAFETARKKRVVLYDIMTERFSIFRRLQKMLVLDENVFGRLKEGSVDEPAVVQQSVHQLFKYVSGTPLKRPAWYFDTTRQGEGLVDVTTHLVDLTIWTCFDGRLLDYRTDVVMKQARHRPTMITAAQFCKVTGESGFPDYLKGRLDSEATLPYYANGEMVYSLGGIHVHVSVEWNFEAPPGASDTQYASFSGTRASVILEQTAQNGYRPRLLVRPARGIGIEQLQGPLEAAIARAQVTCPGLTLEQAADCWLIVIPEECILGHEAHFREVTEKYLEFLKAGALPEWEVSAMLTKYYITTGALERARRNRS